MTDDQFKSWQNFVGDKAGQAVKDYKMIWNKAIDECLNIVNTSNSTVECVERIKRARML